MEHGGAWHAFTIINESETVLNGDMNDSRFRIIIDWFVFERAGETIDKEMCNPGETEFLIDVIVNDDLPNIVMIFWKFINFLETNICIFVNKSGTVLTITFGDDFHMRGTNNFGASASKDESISEPDFFFDVLFLVLNTKVIALSIFHNFFHKDLCFGIIQIRKFCFESVTAAQSEIELHTSN